MSGTLLIASSPVEIEARADSGALSPEGRAAALALFHSLTDRIGHALRHLHGDGTPWPTHRFYFGLETSLEMKALIEGLQETADLLDVTERVPNNGIGLRGLFVRDVAHGHLGVLIAHETHEGYPAPH
jgi:hypothetical protein